MQKLKAKTDKFTWNAFIENKKGPNDEICEGSIIASAWVVTAVQCVAGADKNELVVKVGKTLAPYHSFGWLVLG